MNRDTIEIMAGMTIIALLICVWGIVTMDRTIDRQSTQITNLRAHVEHEHAVNFAYAEQVDHLRSVVASEHARSTALASRVASLTAENAHLERTLRPRPKPRSTAVPARYRGNIPSLIRSLARSRYRAADVEALIILCRRESTFNPSATNGSCKGLFQIKTKNPRWHDPTWNTRAAFAYIARRYHGSPRAALAHSYSRGWY